MKLDGPMLMRIGVTAALLVMIVLTMRPCASATSKFVMGFSEEGSASTLPKPGTVDVPADDPAAGSNYEQIRPDMTPEEIEAAVNRAKQKAAGSGSATP